MSCNCAKIYYVERAIFFRSVRSCPCFLLLLPPAGQLGAAHSVTVGENVGDVVGANVGAVVGANIGAVVGAAVGADVGAVVGGANVGANVGAVVGANVGADVGASEDNISLDGQSITSMIEKGNAKLGTQVHARSSSISTLSKSFGRSSLSLQYHNNCSGTDFDEKE